MIKTLGGVVKEYTNEEEKESLKSLLTKPTYNLTQKYKELEESIKINYIKEIFKELKKIDYIFVS